MNQAGEQLVSPEMQMLRNNKLEGYNYRYRRTFDWDENYELYRDKVITNRLTQRQSVNLPLMKQSVRTLLKDVDDMPVIEFQNLDNDKQAELFKNEYWKHTVECNKMDLQDIVDKRQVFLFGRSFDQWQIIDGEIRMTVQDPVDILVSRYVDPFNLHSSRYLIHANNFIPLSKLSQNKDYDKKAVKDMQKYYISEMGLIKAEENEKLLLQKNQKLSDMGVQDIHSPVLGETYVNITLHFVWREEDDDGKPSDESQIFLYVEADNMRILMKKPLHKVIGDTKDDFWKTHFPYVSWADDLERQDFWSDGIGDIVRTPNKILNAWFSQLVENRTLRNFGMHYYNSNIEGWQPQTNQPVPFGWYGVPVPPNGDIRQLMQKVDIPDLSESLDEMNFVVNMIERSSGATAVQQGVPNQKQVTLGEVQIMVGEAKERIKGMSKFYTPAWKERGLMFLKLCEAAPDKLNAVKIYRKGRNSSNLYAREISPKDWQSASGYNVKVWSQDEKNAMDTDALNKLNAVKANMPNNPKLEEVYKRKLLEFADLKPDEVNEIMQYEEDQAKAAAEGANKPNNIPTESMQLPYDKVPEDIKRQIEQAFGFTPSQMGMAAPTGQPTNQTNGQPQVPGNVPSGLPQPNPVQPMIPGQPM